MLKEHQRFFNILFQAFDLFLVSLAWLLAYPLRFLLLTDYFPVTKGYPIYDQYMVMGLAIIVLWHLVFRWGGLYRSRRSQTLWPEIRSICKLSTIAFVILTAGAYLFTVDQFSRGVFITFAGLSTALLIFERIILRSLFKALRRRGYNIRNLLIVGDNEVGAAFLERIRIHPELGLNVQGVIRLNSSGDENVRARTGLPVLGMDADISPVLRQYQIDHVVLTLKLSERDTLETILGAIVEANVDVLVIPDIHQYITLGCSVEEFEGLPLISLNQSPIVGWNRVAKRVSDIVYASLALAFFSPLMLFISALIKIFSPGPIIHRQERMGLDGQVFQMLKFRTMKVDAEKETGAVWARKDDDRVTWIGKLLRRTSLDELPQLINVLKGEMSCVGPRPERPELVAKFKHNIPHYMLRHKVKAGITGWAQINGWRGNTSLEKRIECDLYYISNWSLFLDFKIMFMTLFKGFISKNAY